MRITEKSEVAVVGGGLVGSLLAVLLADRGHEVTLYERRPDMRDADVDEAGRSINLVLTRRGIRALERVGLAGDALRLTVPVTGRMLHSPEGKLSFQPYGRDETECNYSISRAGLNVFLLSEAEKRGVRVRFRMALNDIDLEARRLTFSDQSSGKLVTVEAPVVFGADGGGSTVRRALGRRDGFEQSADMLEHGYKELVIPAGAGGSFQIEKNALHIWPRGEFMLMALPNLDGSFTVTLYLPWHGEYGFDQLKTTDRVVALFREQFHDAAPLIPDLAASFAANPTGNLGTVRCQPWHLEDRLLLIGDAAHAIVPFFGQGMNAGFEDCTVLDRLLDEHGRGNWGRVFPEFSRLRKPNADAIADMALENFVEMRDKVGDAAFLLRKRVEQRLEQKIPQLYRSRYSMVMYSHIPFRVALDAGLIQQKILDALCEGVDVAENVDLDRARRLIEERLTPFLREHEVALDY